MIPQHNLRQQPVQPEVPHAQVQGQPLIHNQTVDLHPAQGVEQPVQEVDQLAQGGG